MSATGPIDQFISRYQIWHNPTNYDSLRLRTAGYKWILKNTTIKFHVINLQQSITGRQYLQLERLLTEPYVVVHLKQIAVHSETDAIMLQLHAGDLVTYLDNIQENQ